MGSKKHPFFRGGESQKKPYTGGNCPKRGAWTAYRFKGGGLAKKKAMHFI